MQGALKAFTAADAIMHVPTTGLEVARSQVALGLLVEARDTALQVARAPATAKEPAPFKSARDAAAALSEELEGRIPSLTITVKNVPDGATPEVTIDGATVPSETMGEPRKLDPGHHVVTAKAGSGGGQAGGRPRREGREDARDRAPHRRRRGGRGAASHRLRPSRAQRAVGRSPVSKALLFGGFGAAGVGLIVGSITGALSLSKTGNIKSSGACAGSVCNPSEDGDLSSARTMATVSTVAFVVAGVGRGRGGGGAPHARARPRRPRRRARAGAWIEPTFGPGSLGVRGRF